MKPDSFGYSWWYKAVHVPVANPLDVTTPLHPEVTAAREEVVRRRRDQISADIIRAVQRAFESIGKDNT